MILSAYDKDQLTYIKTLVDKDISRHYTIDELARLAALGTTKLKIGFKQVYGKGIYTYLRELRMEKAAELVTGTEKTFKEIARLTGFKHYNNFLAAYKNYHGISPGQARKEDQ